MVLVVKDRVKDTSSTSGSGTITLDNSPPAGYQAFSTLGNGSTTYYTIQGSDDSWEIGLGTYNTNTLTRTTILSSSNNGVIINLPSGSHTVWVDYPAAKAYLSEEGIDKSFTSTASITAGKPVILNSAGTVTQVVETPYLASTISSSNGNEIASVQNYTRDISVAYDTTNDKVGVLYINNNQYPTIAIGSESNNAITWGTPVVVNSSSSNANHSGQKLAFGNGVFVATYNEGNSPVYVKAGSYSGTNSITLGSAIQPNTGTSHFSGGTIAYNPNANKFVFTFAENSSTSIIAYLITNSGTTLTTGNSATITMGYTGNNKVIWNEYDPDTNKQVIMTDHLYGNEGRIYQASISGSNITVPSTHYAITDEGTEEDGSKALSYDPDNNKWILFKANTGNVLRANVLTVSGDTFTSGTVTQLSSQYMRWLAPYYDTEQNKTVLAYNKNTSPYNGEIGFVTISGTTPSFTASTTTVGNQTAERLYTHTSLYNPDTKSGIVIGATPLSNSKAVGYVLYYETLTSSNLTTSNYLGVASTSAGANETVNINIPGSINNDQVGLTIGQDYYAKGDGTIIERTTTTTTTNTTPSQSSNYKFDYASLHGQVSIAYDTVNNKIGVLARNYNSYPAVTIGEESNNSITWGTPVVVNSSTDSSSNRNRLAYGNGVFVAIFTAGNVANMKAGTVSGNSITFGSALTPSNSSINSNQTNVSYNPNANKFIFAKNVNNSTSVDLWIVSNSGSTLSVASSSADATITNAGNNYRVWTNIYDPDTNKTIIGVDNYVGSNYGKLYPVTISGSSLSVSSTPYSMTGGAYEDYSNELIYDSTNNKWLLLQCNETSNYINGTVLTASGNTFTAGTKTVLSSDPARYLGSYYDTVRENFIIGYQYYTTGYYGKLGKVTISGTTPSWTTLSGTIFDQTTERVFPKSAFFNPDTNSGIIAGTFNMSADDGMALVIYYDTTTSSVINGSQFVGKAISSTQLLLGEEKGNSMAGLSNGAITKGKPVVMQADGDVAETGFSTTSVTNTGTASQGSLGNIDPYTQDMFCMAVASDGVTYCFTYQNSTNNYQACKIGTRSGETITWGSEITLSTNTSSDSHFCSYDANANVFVTSYATGNTIKSTAVSFSGNTGTKGTEVTMMDLGSSSGSPQYHYQHWYDSTNKVTVCWANGGVSGNDTNRSSAVTLSLSGTIITLGTLYENTSAGGDYQKGCDITGGKHVCYWRNSSGYPSVMTMTVASDYSITWGTPLVINSASGSFCNPIYNPNYENKAILAGKIATSSNYFSYAGLTISGTSITASNYSDGNINNAQSYVESGGNVGVYSNYSGNYCFVYQTYSPYNSRYNFATTTDGLSLTVATAVTTTAHGSNQFYAGACASDVDAVVVENHRDGSNTQMVYYCFNPTFNFVQSTTSTNLTTTNYLGIASNTVADNEECIIDTQGAVNSNQSSLTPGQLYYVQTDGTLSTTAGSPSVIAGIATSATTLLVTKS